MVQWLQHRHDDALRCKRRSAQSFAHRAVILGQRSAPTVIAMNEDSYWQRELNAALQLEHVFISTQMVFPSAETVDNRRPTPAESQRAVANIRAWRDYLAEPCVAKMIDEGWQWST